MLSESETFPEVTPAPRFEVSTIKHVSWWLLGMASLVGLVGSVLLEVAWGLNIALWVTLLLVCSWAFLRHHKLPQQLWWCWLLAGVFAWLFLWRNSSFLQACNGVAMISALGFGAAFGRNGFRQIGFLTLVWAGFESLGQMLFGWIALVFKDVPWFEASHQRDPKRLLPFMRGLLVTLPLLLVFGLMLRSADAAFATLISRFFSWNIDQSFWSWLFRFGLFTGLVIGFLRFFVLGQIQLNTTPSFQLGKTELVMALGGLNLLFAAFIIIQFGYFFGGQTQITALTGLTYADYARRGFNELLQVVTFTFPVLIFALYFSKINSRINSIVRVLSSVTLVLLTLLLYSAWQRLQLYQQAYGLTEIRFYTTVLLIWLATMIVFYAFTALRQRYSSFVMGTFISIFATVIVLNFINPNAIIVHNNLARADAEQRFDVEYAMQLGADAVPSLMNVKSVFLHSQLETALKNRWGNTTNQDWRSFNFSINQARVLTK
jgi:Domain of unknown function (DUF4173)